MYGEEASKDRECRNWFDKFRSGDFCLKNDQRSGRPDEVGDDQIKAIIESDHPVIVRKIEEMLKIPKSTIDCHIQPLGLVKKLEIWIPHELKEIHLIKRINACGWHLKRNEFEPFLKRIITGDEKWIVYNKINRRIFSTTKNFIGTHENILVYYVPGRIMRVITRRATMLAGDRSRGAISPASIVARRVISRIVCILCDSGAYTSFYAFTRI